jgi:hypothetical protein
MDKKMVPTIMAVQQDPMPHMRWEDQEYNQETEHKFYEVTHRM